MAGKRKLVKAAEKAAMDAEKSRAAAMATADAAAAEPKKQRGSKRTKKSDKAAAETEQPFEMDFVEKQWGPSRCREGDLLHLVRLGLLPAKEMGVWRAAPSTHRFPQLDNGEFVLFEDFMMRGVGIPIHPFLRELCRYWEISVCHLHPNSILAIAIFVAYCEMFLGIEPHFRLFQYFFALRKKGSGSGGSEIAGGCYVRLRNGMKAHWLDCPYGTPHKDWNKRWFYATQDLQSDPVPSDVSCAPERADSWEKPVEKDDMFQVNELLGLMDTDHVTGPVVVTTWMTRRLQPLKARVHPMYEYQGVNDPTREPTAPKELLSVGLANTWVRALFKEDYMKAYPKEPTLPYSISNPPPAVSSLDLVLCDSLLYSSALLDNK